LQPLYFSRGLPSDFLSGGAFSGGVSACARSGLVVLPTESKFCCVSNPTVAILWLPVIVLGWSLFWRVCSLLSVIDGKAQQRATYGVLGSDL